MEIFMPGMIVYHKASCKKMVVIAVNNNDSVHVQDDTGVDKIYPSQALESETAVAIRQKAQAEKFLNDLNGGDDF